MTTRVRVGKLGELELQPGSYAYVGSAFGPGGLAGRLGHHLKVSHRPHWHIDYVRAHCSVREVWHTVDAAVWEHAWADRLAEMPGAHKPGVRFGASDCSCASHLIHFDEVPSLRSFRQGSQAKIRLWREARDSDPGMGRIGRAQGISDGLDDASGRRGFHR